MAIGARAQSAKTYLDRHYKKNDEKGIPGFANLEADELIKHALKALQGCVHGDGKSLDAQCAQVAIVSRGQPFTIYDGASIAPYIDQINAEAPPVVAAGASEEKAAVDGDGDVTMA